MLVPSERWELPPMQISELAQEHCLVGVRPEAGAEQLLLAELQSPSLQDSGLDLIQCHMPGAGSWVLGIQAVGGAWLSPQGPGHRKSLLWGLPEVTASPHCGHVGKLGGQCSGWGGV